MRSSPMLCGLWLGLGLLMGACPPIGVQETDPGTDEGGETNSCRPGAEGCICGDDASCEPGLLCASMVCIAHESVTTSGPTSQVTSTEATDPTSASTETDGPTSVGDTETRPSECDPEDGVQNPACTDPSALYCGAEGVCVNCKTIACAKVSADAPLCNSDTGACVQCTAADASACVQTTPVCDAAAGSCVPCTAHDQCDSGACQLATGACFEESLYVNNAAECVVGNGTKSFPFCEIQEAADKIVMGSPVAILVASSSMPYTQQVQIAPEATVAIIREGASTAKLEVNMLDALVANEGATLYVRGLQISKDQGSNGILCTGAEVWLDQVQLVQLKRLGVNGINNCTLRMRRSRVWKNAGGGIKLTGGSLYLENSLIVSNGDSYALVAGVATSSGTSVEALYTSIIDNRAKAGIADSLHCVNPGVVAVRNSIVLGQTAMSSVNCPLATATTSAVDSASLIGEGNMMLGALDPDWFVLPQDGDFTVKMDGPFEGVAVWKSGDPSSDYNGDPRPARAEATDYAGADRPK